MLIILNLIIEAAALAVGVIMLVLPRRKGSRSISLSAYAGLLIAGTLCFLGLSFTFNPQAILVLKILGAVCYIFLPVLVASEFLNHEENQSKPARLWFLFIILCAILLLGFLFLIPLQATRSASQPVAFLIPSPFHQWGWLVMAGFIGIGLVLLRWETKYPHRVTVNKQELFDLIGDSIIIIDEKDRITDLNPAAEELVGVSVADARGTPVESFLTNWGSISTTDETVEREFRGSISLNKQWHQFNVRIRRLETGDGKAIILKEMTPRKGVDETRQRAREEMFNLLRSLFKSASSSQTSSDFLRDVLFQIAYTFHAESGAIYLVESVADVKKAKFTLAARYGRSLEDKESLRKVQAALTSAREQLVSKEPLIISETATDHRLADLAAIFSSQTLVLFPLGFGEQLLGVLLVGRASAFSTDESFRLGVATEELASFLYSDRKRKADIALAERHRLAQDLHDSITQKLYGLVTLTEAVKLGIETGAKIDENGMIEKISSNARQALREMRLFLFELEPVNIERDGLVATLQSRLASVEGRSGIQARMLADSDIYLSTDKETELYYIVEEALNNILKHANAKSVLVKLYNKKSALHLEISDNGVGFNVDEVQVGGKGLRNIRERAKRIDGKLTITSSPNQGTKITMVVPQ